jgi:hypothetical protein
MKFTPFFLLLFVSHIGMAQFVGPHAYLKGDYVELGINGFGGFEGAFTDVSLLPTGYHQRPINPRFAMVANPQMNGWSGSAFDGDFVTVGTLENGWGFEIVNTVGPSTSAMNKCTGTIEIPGTITTYTNSSTQTSLTWNGNYTGSGYDLDYTIKYNLVKNELLYVTTVSITNNGPLIPEYYYYRTIDPDNNQSITSLGTTLNTITFQPDAVSDRAQVSATQAAPWNSAISFIGYSPNFKASVGGFSPGDGSDIWNGLAGTFNTVGISYYADESISLGYRILNFAAGATETFNFFTVFADSLLNEDFELATLNYVDAGLVIENDSLPDSVYACGSLQVNLEGYLLDNYNWNWSPNTYLNTDTGLSVICNPLDTITYTILGTPIGLGVSQLLSFTVIPSIEPSIGYVLPGPQCSTYDLNTLVYLDLNNVANDSSFHSSIPTNGFDLSNQFPINVVTPLDLVYVMMVDSTTGCYDVDLVSIVWQDVIFELNLTTTSCVASTGTASVSGITALPGTYSILWSSGDTTSTTSSLPPGAISVAITGPGGCTTFASDFISENNFYFIADPFPSGCGNPTGGVLTYFFGDSTNTYTTTWSNGDTSANLLNVLYGLYSLTAVNQDGCIYFDTVTVPNLITTFSLTSAIFDATCSTCANGSAYTFLSGSPILPVTYLWSNGATTPNIFTLLPGTYTVLATDAVGCTYADTFYVGYPGSVNEFTNGLSFRVFPNPAKDFVQIEASFNINLAKLISVEGREVFCMNVNSNMLNLDLKNIGKGLYTLILTSGNGQGVSKIIKE